MISIQKVTTKDNNLNIAELFAGCETQRGCYKGLKPDGKTKIAWTEPRPLDWSSHFNGDMQGKSAVDLVQKKAKWFAVDVDLNIEPKKFCRDVFSKLGYEYFVFRTVSGRFRVVKFYDDWHNPEQLQKEGEELEKKLDNIGYKCDEGATVPSGWDYKTDAPGRWIYLPYSNGETYCYTPDGLPLTLKQFEYRAQHKDNPLVVASVGVGSKACKHKALWCAQLYNKVNPTLALDLNEFHKNMGENISDYEDALIKHEKTIADPKWNLESYSKGLPTWIKEMVGTAPNFGTRFVSAVVEQMSDNYIYVRCFKEFYERSSDTWVDKEGLNDDWYHQNNGKPIVKDLLNNPNLIKVIQTTVHPAYKPGVIELGHNEVPGIKKGRYYNLHIPSNFMPIEGDSSKFFEYWKWAIGDDVIADYFFQYCALHFQHPGKKSHWCTLIISAPGLGKDLFSEIVGNALGNQNVVLNCSFDKMTNDHSTLIEGKQIMFVNELMLTGQRIEGKVLTNKLKPYITNETAVVNPKFKKEIVIPNYVNLYLFTNDDKPLNLEKEDRRLFVIKVKWTKDEIKEKIKDYLPHLKELKKNPGPFIHAMQNYPISDLDFFEGDAPWTEHKQELITDSKGDFNNLMDSALDERTFPFASKNWDDKVGDTGTPSSWRYRGFINVDNLAVALKHDKKFQKKFFDDYMLQQWIKQNAIPWPNDKLTKRAILSSGQRPHLWLLEDLEVEIKNENTFTRETNPSSALYASTAIIIPKDQPLPPTHIKVKISQLSEGQLGKQYDECRFKHRGEREYTSKGTEDIPF